MTKFAVAGRGGGLASAPSVGPSHNACAGTSRIFRQWSSAFSICPGMSFTPAELASRGLDHLGSWFVPTGDAAGLHHVYTQSEAIAAYRATGEFPDGTVLIKELTHHRRANYTTGADVASATDTTQWFSTGWPAAAPR